MPQTEDEEVKNYLASLKEYREYTYRKIERQKKRFRIIKIIGWTGILLLFFITLIPFLYCILACYNTLFVTSFYLNVMTTCNIIMYIVSAISVLFACYCYNFEKTHDIY